MALRRPYFGGVPCLLWSNCRFPQTSPSDSRAPPTHDVVKDLKAAAVHLQELFAQDAALLARKRKSWVPIVGLVEETEPEKAAALADAVVAAVGAGHADKLISPQAPKSIASPQPNHGALNECPPKRACDGLRHHGLVEQRDLRRGAAPRQLCAHKRRTHTHSYSKDGVSFDTVPPHGKSPAPALIYYCENETIDGVPFSPDPTMQRSFPFVHLPHKRGGLIPLVGDHSSSIMRSCPIRSHISASTQD
ncbi:hypothetical protein BC826DRAFT_966931 [Russula brevipes]|nr:hypothetical protein BC826DRAFT_966931 [Russula brevipes]